MKKIGILVIVFALIVITAACSGGGGGGGTAPNYDITSWTYVDSTNINGINKNPIYSGYEPQVTAFNSKLYIAWGETNGVSNQIRVAVYNGNDTSPGWSFVDGNGVNGINRNAANNAGVSRLIVFNGKLYAAWTESDAALVYHLRVAVYNGDDASPSWSFVDGNGAKGLNKNTAMNANNSQFAILGTKLYVLWDEPNGAAFQIRAAVYNGNDASPSWAFVDGNGLNGINKNPTLTAGAPYPAIYGSKLYAAWFENNGTHQQLRIAVFNGNDAAPSWTFVDGNGVNGINKDISHDAERPQLAVFEDKLYVIWTENNQVRVALYNGNDGSPAWTFVDGNGANGINKDPLRPASYPRLAVFGTKLYATWSESTGTPNQIRVARYNGNDASPSWAFVDGNGANGINKDTTRFAYLSQLAVVGTKLYAVWNEDNGTAYQIRVAVGK
jgi:hypothetical protein